MQEERKTGDLSALLAALRAAAKLTIADGKVTVSTDTAEIDALRAEMNARRDAVVFGGPRERDEILCAFQRDEYRLGAWHYTLGQNIYGWCVGESLRSNMGGGRWAQTPHGYTLAQAIEWGCEQAQRRNVKFSFSLSKLPKDTRVEVEALIASRA